MTRVVARGGAALGLLVPCEKGPVGFAAGPAAGTRGGVEEAGGCRPGPADHLPAPRCVDSTASRPGLASPALPGPGHREQSATTRGEPRSRRDGYAGGGGCRSATGSAAGAWELALTRGRGVEPAGPGWPQELWSNGGRALPSEPWSKGPRTPQPPRMQRETPALTPRPPALLVLEGAVAPAPSPTLDLVREGRCL